MAKEILIFILIYIHSCTANDACRKTPTVPMATIAGDGHIGENQKALGGYVDIAENWKGTSLSICFWMFPHRYMQSTNAMISFSPTNTGDVFFLFGINDFTLAWIFFNCILTTGYEPPRREWTHVCVSSEGNIVDVYINGNKTVLLNCDLENGGIQNKLTEIYVKIGGGHQITTPLSGKVADLRIYWRSLKPEEVKEIRNFTDTKCDFEDVIERLDVQQTSSEENDDDGQTDKSEEESGEKARRKRNTPNNSSESDTSTFVISRRTSSTSEGKSSSFVKISYIGTELLLKKYIPYIVLYIAEKNNFENAKKVCQNRNSMLPHLQIHGEDLLQILIYDFVFNSGIAAVETWVDHENQTNSEKCTKGRIISRSKLELGLGPELCNNTEVNYFCIIEKGKYFRFIGLNDREYQVYPVPYEVGQFETIDIIRLEFDKGMFSFTDVTSPSADFIYRSYGLKTETLVGRYLWKTKDSKNELYMTLTTCTDSEFTCSEGTCINMTTVCDLKKECPDKSEERITLCMPSIKADEQYDKRLSPYTNSDQATTELVLYFEVLRISEFNIEQSVVHMYVSCNATWKDPRRSYKFLKGSDLNFILEEDLITYWQPHIVVRGATHETEENLSFRSNPGKMTAKAKTNGTYIFYDANRVDYFEGEEVMLTHVTLSPLSIMCSMNLFYYPFDDQNCTFTLEIVDEYTDKIGWKRNVGEIKLGNTVYLALYEILGFRHEYQGEKHVQIWLAVSRKYGAFIFNTILPCIVLEIIGIATHLLPIHDYADRVSVTLSCLIVMASLFTTTSGTLPESAEPKLLDIWMFAHVLLLLCVFLSHLAVIYLHDREIRKGTQKTVEDITKEKVHLNWMKKQSELVEEIKRTKGKNSNMRSAWSDCERDSDMNGNKWYKFSAKKSNIITFIINVILYIGFLLLFFLTAAKFFVKLFNKK